MVRATRRTRSKPRADNPRVPAADDTIARALSSTPGHNTRRGAVALTRTRVTVSYRERWISRARLTRARITRDDSPLTSCPRASIGTGVSVTCMSIRSASGPDNFARYLVISNSEQIQERLGSPAYPQIHCCVPQFSVEAHRGAADRRGSEGFGTHWPPHSQTQAVDRIATERDSQAAGNQCLDAAELGNWPMQDRSSVLPGHHLFSRL